MDDESLEKIVAAALARLRNSVECGTPFMGQRILEWLGSLYPNHSLQEYCTHPDAFPLLLDAVVVGKNSTRNTGYLFPT